MNDRPCSIAGCPNRMHATGLCTTHIQRRKKGLPMEAPILQRLAGETVADKLRLNHTVHGTCWRWNGARNHKGYAQIRFRGVTKMAHRLAYEFAKGPIPAGLEIDHLCNVRDCINPAHLEAVTHSENLRRIAERNPRTHCSRDHELTPENTYLDSRGQRACRICRRAQRKAYRESRKKVA